MSQLVISKDLLSALLSPHAVERQAAEHALSQLSLAQRVSGFLTILQQQQSLLDPSLLQLAAVLLRRDIIRIPNSSDLESLVEPLFHLWQKQLDSTTTNTAIAYCLAEIVACLEFLDSTTASIRVVNRILASSSQTTVTLWMAVIQRAPKAFARSGKIQQLISEQLQHSLSTLKLIVLAAIAVEDDIALCQQLATHGLLPWLHQQQQQAITNDDDEAILWELLVQAAEEAPALLASDRNVLTAVYQFCGGRPNGLGAVQTIALLSQSPHLQALLREDDGRLQHMVVQGNAHVLEICWRTLVGSYQDWEDNDWIQSPVPLHEDGVEDGDDADFAEALLRDLIHSQPVHSMQTLLPVIQQGLLSPSSSHPSIPRAALATLQCMAEAAPISFQPHIPVAIQAALAYAQQQQQHPRVTYQAIRLIGVLCEVAPSVRKLYASAIWETLANLVVSSTVPRIVAMTCQAMVAVCRPGSDMDDETEPETMLLPYLEGILRALLSGPLGPNGIADSVVKLRAINAMAGIAQVSGPAFAPYYGLVMPTLLAYAAAPSSHANNYYETCQLAGAALEAATMVGQAIGSEQRDLFLPDANTILQQWVIPCLVHQQSRFPMEYLLPACARIASFMGEEYAPFVSIVLPCLLERAKGDHGADIECSEGDLNRLDAGKRNMIDLDNETGVESMTVSVPGRGVTKITLNTTKIQEKVQACRAVYEHAAAMGASFGPHCASCLDMFLPLVEYKFSAELRATAAQTVAVLFEAACGYGEPAGMDLPKVYLPRIIHAISNRISKEDTADMEILYALADSLSEVCRATYHCVSDGGSDVISNLTVRDVSSVVCVCMESISSCLARRSETFQRLEVDVPSDEERFALQGFLKAEENLLTPLVDTVGYVLKCFRSDFFPLFESDVAPVLTPYLTGGNDIRATLSAVCLFDDCIEFCGSNAAEKFAPILVQAVTRGLDDAKNGNDADLKRASIYGISQIARHAPAALDTQVVKDFVEKLRLITSKPKDPDGDAVIYENSVSALASLLLFSPFEASGFVKRDEFISFYLKNLPLREDEDEARFCHEGLCNLIESGTINVIKECKEIVRVIGETLALVEDSEHVASQDTCERLTGILFRLQQEVPSDDLQSSFVALPADCQAAINAQFNLHAHKFTNVVSP